MPKHVKHASGTCAEEILNVPRTDLKVRLRLVGEDMKMVIAGGIALFLFLLIFALGQLQEIFRAL